MAQTTVQTPPVTTSVTALDVTRWEYEAGGSLNDECQTTTAATSCTTTGADRRTAYTYDGLGRTATTTLYSCASAGSNRGGWTTTYNPNGDAQVASIAYSGTAMVRSMRPPARRSTRARTRWPSPTSRRATAREASITRGATVLTDYAYSADGTVSSRIDRDPVSGTAYTTSFTYDWAKRNAGASSSDLFSATVNLTRPRRYVL